MSQHPTPEPRSDYGLKKYANVIATVTVAVAITGGIIAFLAWYTGREQLQTGREQLRTTQLQSRPYVRERPIFTTKGQASLSAFILSENLSPIPAHIIYSQDKIWVGGETNGSFLYNKTGDILYQHKNGASELPPLPKTLAKEAIAGRVDIMIGTCVVYGSISPSDSRRWESRGLYCYTPTVEEPTNEYIVETEVSADANHCDSSTLRSEWLERRGKTRELNPSVSDYGRRSSQ
jgi:hypothetical protein